MKKIFKQKQIFIFIYLVSYFLFGQLNLAFAQTSGYDYTKAGVGDQIKQFLCAPTEQNGTSNSANSSGSVEYAGQNNQASGDLYNCINRMYKFAIVIAAVVGVFFIVIAGYLYMGAGGNQESVDKAKDILATTITSIVILFAGYILLKAINPDLIQFRSIQPPSVRLEPAEAPGGEPSAQNIPLSGQQTTPLANRANGTIDQLNSAGCDITSESRPRNELPNLSSAIWNKLLQICQVASKNGFRPKVTSTVRRESTGSYHQKACAVDFADGQGNGFFNIKTKQGRASGIALYNAAKQAGIEESRINPGSDREQTYHIHIDLGTQCPN